jgi:hypothetical protein
MRVWFECLATFPRRTEFSDERKTREAAESYTVGAEDKLGGASSAQRGADEAVVAVVGGGLQGEGGAE